MLLTLIQNGMMVQIHLKIEKKISKNCDVNMKWTLSRKNVNMNTMSALNEMTIASSKTCSNKLIYGILIWCRGWKNRTVPFFGKYHISHLLPIIWWFNIIIDFKVLTQFVGKCDFWSFWGDKQQKKTKVISEYSTMANSSC